MPTEPFVDLSSGYFQRALDQLPKQGAKAPWRLNHNYLTDLITLRHERLEDGALRFSASASARPAGSKAVAAAA
jgi:monooxygenase